MSSDQSTMMEQCAAFNQTGPEHASIARFAGTFRAEVKIWMSPGQPPMTSTGTMVSTTILGGRFLRQDYKDDSGMFEGAGFWGYNTVDKRFEGFWIDSMATFFQLERGRHEPGEDKYVMEGTMTDPGGGGTVRKRSIIRFLGADRHSMEMFFGTPDGGEFRGMEIQYTRA